MEPFEALEATDTTGPAFTIRGNPDVATIFVSGITGGATVTLQSRPLAGGAWVPVGNGSWDSNETRVLDAPAFTAYRAVASAAGPVVQVIAPAGVRAL